VLILWKCQFFVVFFSNLTYQPFLTVVELTNVNMLQAEYGCDLFIWDDKLDEGTMMNSQKSGKYYDAGSSSGCNNCVMTMEFLREFGNDFGKEFGKEFGEEYGKRIEKGNGKEINSKKHEKLKMKFEAEKKKNFGLIVALVVSWIFFSFVFKLM